jgi:hypothetical protein
VYQPLVDQALERIQQTAHDLLVPRGAQPTTIKGLTVGAPVTVTMSPAVSGIVLHTRMNPETGKTELVVLTRDKGIVVAAPDEVTPGLPSSEQPPTSTGSTTGPLPSGPENQTTFATSHSIHAGDMVQTPMGIGRVTREPAAGGDLVDVDLGPTGKFVLRRSELTVVPPPAPAPTS